MPAITLRDCRPQDAADIQVGVNVQRVWLWRCPPRGPVDKGEYTMDFRPITHLDLHRAGYTGLYHHNLAGLNQVEMWEKGRRLWCIKLRKDIDES